MRALIIADVQNDVLPGGALPVPNRDAVIPVVNGIVRHYPMVVATQDWHPPNHGSFAVNHAGRHPYDQIQLEGLPQTLWPVHCVQHSLGAQFATDLDQGAIRRVFQKGVDPDIDSYSGFFDNGHRRSTGLGEWLKEKGVEEVHLCGLATDYCVKFSALDAIKFGFRVRLLPEACRGINLQPTDIAGALEEMRQAGVSGIPLG